MNLKCLVKIFLLITIAGCGTNSTKIPDDGQYDNGLIKSIQVSNNNFIVSTSTPTFFEINYYTNSEDYHGYSADNSKSSQHNFSIFGSPNTQYTMELKVLNSESFQDTIFNFSFSHNSQSFLQVHIVDVAQGDGNLIITPDNKYIAVDGGYGTHEPNFGQYGGSDDGPWDGDGEPLMLNYVNSLGITDFQYLIETHNHADHWGGIDDIMDSGYINYENSLSVGHNLGFTSGDYLIGDESSEFSIRIINIGLPSGVEDVTNNDSIVLRIIFGKAEYLLTGDAEESLESSIIADGYDISSDVLKVGHHGSNSSSSTPFLAEVLNQYCKVGTVSFGDDNPYGHPHSISRFNAYEMYYTNQPEQPSNLENQHFNSGNIITYTDGEVIIIKTEN